MKKLKVVYLKGIPTIKIDGKVCDDIIELKLKFTAKDIPYVVMTRYAREIDVEVEDFTWSEMPVISDFARTPDPGKSHLHTAHSE